MQDRLETPARLCIAEDALAQTRSVEPPVRGEHPRAEGVDHGGERRLSRLDHLPRDDVGVDHRDAMSRKKIRDGGLAAGDAAGESYPNGVILFEGFKAAQEGT